MVAPSLMKSTLYNKNVIKICIGKLGGKNKRWAPK